jgi:hypothetical protein
VGLLTLMILSDPTINNSPLTDPNADSIATQPSDRGLQ